MHGLLRGIHQSPGHLGVLRRTCNQTTTEFALLCIDRVDTFPDPLQSVARIADLLETLECRDRAVFRRLVRKMLFVEMTTSELQTHRSVSYTHLTLPTILLV